MHWNYCPRCSKEGIEWVKDKNWSCPHCGFRLYFNVATSTAAFLLYQGKLLTVRRNREPGLGFLDLPGGFVDPGESAEDALKREIREELHISAGPLQYLFSLPNHYPYKDVNYRTCDLFFSASIDEIPQSFQKDEISEILLIQPDELHVEDFAFSSIRKALAKFLL